MKHSWYYRAVCGAVRMFFPRAQTVYEELPDGEPAVYVCNHASIRGPVMMALDFHRPHQTWAVNLACDKETAKCFAFHDILFGNSRKCKAFWRFLSNAIAVGLPPLVRDSDTIPVYHDERIVATFKQSIRALEAGDDLVIFAEKPKRYTEYVCDINDGFVNIAGMYYRRTKKRLKFYPVYLEKKNAKICVGKPIIYDPEEPIKTQKEKIVHYLRDNIDRLGRALPSHRPVPFLPQRWYDAYGCYEDDVPGYWKMIQDDSERRRKRSEANKTC